MNELEPYIKRSRNYIIACLNTSKPTRVDVATYVHDSFAKDEEKMKIQCLDP